MTKLLHSSGSLWRKVWRPVAVVAGLALVAIAVGEGSQDRSPAAASATPSQAPTTVSIPTSEPTSTSSTTSTPVPLVAWSGPVEHLFFHTLVIDPALAFNNNGDAQGFRNYFVTVKEFRAIVDQLYAKGWTLVDIHRAVAGTVRVPVGRQPVVISEDDVNYYDYERPHGLGWRLALDATGAVKVEVHDGGGVHLTNDDLVPIIDQFVAKHPDFSADGAKGVLGLTGYQGLFGERIQDPASPDYHAAVARAKAIAAELKTTGWVLANHSYGHIDLSRTDTAFAKIDTIRWEAEADPIIGPTDVYIYPFGARPPAATIAMLHDHGLNVLCDIDTGPRMITVGDVTIMSRRHIDGLALRQQRAELSLLFDTATVTDRAGRSL